MIAPARPRGFPPIKDTAARSHWDDDVRLGLLWQPHLEAKDLKPWKQLVDLLFFYLSFQQSYLILIPILQ